MQAWRKSAGFNFYQSSSRKDVNSSGDLSARNDIRGGSGTGLGGVILEYGDANSQHRDAYHHVEKKSNASRKTTKKKGKHQKMKKRRNRRGWKQSRYSKARKRTRVEGSAFTSKNIGSTWSANERGIRSTTTPGSQPYMSVSKLEPGLKNVGGALIEY